MQGAVVNRRETESLLEQVAAGKVSVEAAAEQLLCAPFEDLGYARPDFARAHRQGTGEVVYGEGKTAEQIAGICRSLVEHGQQHVLVTRLDEAKAAALEAAFADGAKAGGSGVSSAVPYGEGEAACAGGVVGDSPETGDSLAAGAALDTLPDGSAALGSALAFLYRSDARLGVVGGMPGEPREGCVVVAAAGTSDVPVAEEAALTAEFMGSAVVRCYDVGVAGIHRLFACADDLARARACVVVAGMEGALPSVVAGLVSCPVIAVPTSVGYGASFGGVAALLAMLNSCASGVSVVNIDNGFGAGYQASLINRR